jgi:hypothetical protein
MNNYFELADGSQSHLYCAGDTFTVQESGVHSPGSIVSFIAIRDSVVLVKTVTGICGFDLVDGESGCYECWHNLMPTEETKQAVARRANRGKSKKITQTDRLLEHFKAGHSITSLEAFNTLGITQLSSRIIALEREGHLIRHDRIKVKNRFGESISIVKYSMDG